MDYIVTERLKHPSNLHKADIAQFVQPSEAIKYAKDKAKERLKYDSTTPFCYSVSKDGEITNMYFNADDLTKD